MTHHNATATVLAFTLASATAVAATRPEQSQHPSPSTTASTTAITPAQRAVTRLEDARVTLARLAEHSMPQQLREALGPLTTEFRDLYETYAGRKMPTWHGVLPAKTSTTRTWQESYQALSSELTKAVDAQQGSDIPAGVRDDLQLFKRQLEEFQYAATHAKS